MFSGRRARRDASAGVTSGRFVDSHLTTEVASARPALRRQRTGRAQFKRAPRSLQHPAFQRIWLAGTGSNIARFTDFTVIAWLVVQRVDDVAAIGALVFLRFISFLVFGPFVGLVSDRFPRIRILRVTQAGVGVLAMLLAVLLLTGQVQLWHLYAYTFLSGLLFMFEISARRPYISALLGQKYLTPALALDMISLNVAWFLGANVGGAVVAVLPAQYLYFGIGTVFIANVYYLRNLPVLFRKEMAESRETALQSLAGGIRYARRNRLILGGLIVVGINNFTGHTFESMAPVFAADVYGAGPLMFGLLMSAQGLGALIVSISLVKYGRRIRQPALFMITAALAQHFVAFGFSFAGIAVLGFVTLFLLGTLSMVFGIMHNTLVLAATPNKYRGRVVGLQLVAMGMFPLGALAVGQLALAVGLQEAVRVFTVTGTLMLLAVLVLFPELRRGTSVLRDETTESSPVPA